MKYLVDTDWVADYLKGREPAVLLLSDLAPEGLAISLLTYGEIQEGVVYGSNRRAHEQAFQNFLRGVDVMPLTRPAMRRFAAIRGGLRQKGQLIGDMDLLIACTALHYGLTLITRNRRHFERVPELVLYES